MDSKEASKLQPGDRVLGVGDEYFTGLYGFTTNGVIQFVTDDYRGILILRDDSKAPMWVSARHVMKFSYEGERKAWRSNSKTEREEQVRNGYRAGPFERVAKPLTDLDLGRRYSTRSLLEVQRIIVKASARTGGTTALRRIFNGVGLDDIQCIQPWHYDPVYRACAAAIEEVEIEALL